MSLRLPVDVTRTSPPNSLRRIDGMANVVRLNVFFATILCKELERLERKVRPTAESDGIYPIEGLNSDERDWVSKMFLETAKLRRSASRERSRIIKLNEKIREKAVKEVKAGRPGYSQNQPAGSSIGIESDPEHLSDDELDRLRRLDGALG